MRFNYEYRTSDNVRHEGAINAASRDAAFALLRQRGIKPGCVTEAPGFFNKLFGKGKRWIAIALLALLAGAGWYAAVTGSRPDGEPMPRHQIYGDPAIIAEWAKTDYRSVFDNVADRFLARYAQPGREVRRADGGLLAAVAADLPSAVGREVPVEESDGAEVRELKRIVAWMKREAREYLADEKGNPQLFLMRLEERQRMELSLYNYVKSQLENEKSLSAWEEKNESLRKVGLPTIPVSDAVATEVLD